MVNSLFSTEHIEQLCHRRFGIGADGFILLENEPGYDFKMVYYNADGRQSTMCGNGGRCTVKFAHDLGIFKEKTRFLAIDGPHEASLLADQVSLGMIPVSDIENTADGLFLNTGSPHLIVFTENLDLLNVKEEGAKLRYSPFWTERGGVNVNFVETLDPSTVKIRTYERGVEDETFSCGTGVTAGVLATYFTKKSTLNHLHIETLGGRLSVSFTPSDDYNSFHHIELIGPALKVFEGQF